MAEHRTQHSSSPRSPSHDPTEPLSRAVEAVGAVIAGIRPDQWTAPTPCTEWDVSRVVEHLVGMNLVFEAMLRDAPPPERGSLANDDPVEAFRSSSSLLLQAFSAPWVIEREYVSPMGSATGADRLQIRLYDLLVHGWDLAQATGQPDGIPEDLAEASLAFAQKQVIMAMRGERFQPPTEVGPEARGIERLVAFLGRRVPG